MTRRMLAHLENRVWRQSTTVLMALLACAGNLRAQCASDLRSEIDALDNIGRRISAPANGMSPGEAKRQTDKGADSATSVRGDSGRSASPAWALAMKRLESGDAYAAGLGLAGGAASCLLERREVYEAAVRSALLKMDSTTATEDEVRKATVSGTAAVLATRYSSSDRIAFVFGFGMTRFFRDRDAETWKIVNRKPPINPANPGDTALRQFIVRSSNARTFPVATTGLTVTMRDRNPTRRFTSNAGVRNDIAWILDRLVPTTLFGTVQLGGDEGVVSGTSLGVGWRVLGEVSLLAGYSLARTSTLRADVRGAWNNTTVHPPGLLELPAGETEQTIMGTRSAAALTVTLTVPLALRAGFLGR